MVKLLHRVVAVAHEIGNVFYSDINHKLKCAIVIG